MRKLFTYALLVITFPTICLAGENELFRVREFIKTNSGAKTCVVRVDRGEGWRNTFTYLSCVSPEGKPVGLRVLSNSIDDTEDLPFILAIDSLKTAGFSVQIVKFDQVIANK